MDVPSSQTTEYGTLVWAEVVELTLAALHNVLWRRPAKSDTSVLDRLLLVTAPDRPSGTLSRTSTSAASDALVHLSIGDAQPTGDSAILIVASLAHHTRSFLIPLFAIRVCGS